LSRATIVFAARCGRYRPRMTYWPFWLGGIALAGVALLHWWTLGQLMSVSSRFSALVDRGRGVTPTRPEPSSTHVVFFAGIALGGLVSMLLAGAFAPTLFDVGPAFTSTFGGSPLTTTLVMTGGGVLVGVGTRMASGCTSGHGLCGVARLQPGSLLATCAFFGTGVVVSLALSAVTR
jgi:uncharacterized membrane protein YedE/YeeE